MMELLTFADKYDVKYSLEQAVLLSNFEGFIEGLENKIKEVNSRDIGEYDSPDIESCWIHYWDPCIPTEVLEVLGFEEGYNYLNDFLGWDYHDFREHLDSGEFWDFGDEKTKPSPDMKKILTEWFKEVVFDNYNHFQVKMAAPTLSHTIDFDLIELLDSFHNETEKIEISLKLIKTIDKHPHNNLDSIFRRIEIENSTLFRDIEKVLDEYEFLEGEILINTCTRIQGYLIRKIFRITAELHLLNVELDEVVKTHEKIYGALDVATELIKQYLKGVEETYSDIDFWVDFLEANDRQEVEKLKELKKSA